MTIDQTIRNEACALLSNAIEHIQNADLSNVDEWKTAVDTAETGMVNASSMLNLVKNPDRVRGVHTMTKFSTSCDLLWKDGEQWSRAVGYLKPCSCCKRGDIHLILTEPRKTLRCIQRSQVIVLNYLRSA